MSRTVFLRRTKLASRLAPALILPLLAGCAGAGGGGGGSYGGGEALEHEQTVAACRQRADQAYDITHREQIYSSGSEVNTPFSANYQPGIPDRGLSDMFQHDQMVTDCVRNTGTEGDRTPQTPQAAPGGVPGPAPHS